MTASASSIAIDARPEVQYLLRLGDTCLILAQRLGQWCGHAPILEEDIAMTNMALDLVGQARALLTRAGQLEGRAHDEDQLAFLRDERDYFNATLAELPRGDFAFTVLRNAMAATWLRLMWERLVHSSDAELAAIAAKGLQQRMEAALAQLWRYAAELFTDDATDTAARASGLGPAWSELREPWQAEMAALLQEATLDMPAESAFRSTGRNGVHSEHMGFILAVMQHLQRAYPGGVW